MNTNNFKDYVYYGAEKYPTVQILKQMIIVFICFAGIGSVWGISSGGKFLVYSIAIDVLVIAYTISVFVLQRKWKLDKFSTRFWVSGIFSAFSSAFFLLFLYLILEGSDEKVSSLYKLCIIIGLLLFLLIYFTIVILKVHQGEFSDKRAVKKSRATQFALLGAIAGITFARIFLSNSNQQTATALAVLCFFIISLLFSLGTINFLKCYYIKKYSIVGDDLEEVIILPETVKRARKKMTTGKKVLLLCLLVPVVFF